MKRYDPTTGLCHDGEAQWCADEVHADLHQQLTILIEFIEHTRAMSCACITSRCFVCAQARRIVGE